MRACPTLVSQESPSGSKLTSTSLMCYNSSTLFSIRSTDFVPHLEVIGHGFVRRCHWRRQVECGDYGEDEGGFIFGR
ncbi:hypothetical protein Tco_1539660 [Tanacetum coccineum]